MILGFKTELHPTNQQKMLLAKHAGVARHAYNALRLAVGVVR